MSLIDETHPAAPAVGPISREARGLAIVLLFAAYEELLTSLTRTLLETVVRMRISNRRMQPGFKAFAVRNSVRSLRDVSERKLFVSAIPTMLELTERTDQHPTVDTNDFPHDGSFMKRTQIEVWARTFRVGPPATILKRTWNSIDAVVSQRNQVAHGALTPQDVGRNYTESEVRKLVSDWSADWEDFLLHVEKCASTRDFFRVPR
nr:MAE_28990/MAE_18760 family HEPN-like nuclease [Microbacterium sp. CFBP 8794]